MKKGQLLLRFDMDLIKSKGKPVIVTNTDDYADIVPEADRKVDRNTKLLTLIK